MGVEINRGGLAFKATIDDKEVIQSVQRLKITMGSYQNIAEKATDTARLKEYNKKIQDIEAEIKRLSNVGKAGFDSMGNAINKTTGFTAALKTTLLGVFSALGVVSLIAEVVQLGKELFNISQKSEGIEIAFSRLNNPDLLNKLRAATKGTVDDLKLMQTAVKANDFRIPMDVLAKGLAFAQKKARDTGKEVDFLVESLIDGIGRKSVLKIDNLNISITEVQQEFKKTGDFAVAVGNIIDREMEKSGESIDLFADKIGKTATIWQNFKTKTADFFRDFFNPEALDVNKATKKSQEILAMFTKANFKGAEQAERERLIKIAEDAVKKQTAVYLKAKKNFETSPGSSFADIQLSKASTDLLALQNVSAELKAQNKEILTRNRLSQGYLSVVELQAEAESKRDQASKIFPTDKSQIELRSKLLKEAEDIDAKIAEINGKAQKKRDKAGESAAAKQKRLDEQSLKAKEALQQKIDDLDDEYALKSLSKDDAEIQAVRKKFKNITDEVSKFNADPKNRLNQVNGSSLNKTRDAAIADLTYSQNTERLKIELDKQKVIFEDFEQYKLNFGADAAEKKYSADLKGFKTYTEYLKSKLALTLGSIRGVPTGGETERLGAISANLAASSKADQAIHDQQLIEFMAYQKKRKVIAEKYLAIAEKLRKAGNDAEAAFAIKQGEDELTELDKTNIKKLESYKLLFDGIIALSKRQKRLLIEELEKELKVVKITTAAKLEIQKQINELKTALKDGTADDLNAAATALGNIANEISIIDVNFGNLLNTISKVVSGFAEIQKQKNAYDKAKTNNDKFGQVLAGAGIVGAAIGIVSSAVGYFKGLKEAGKAARKEVDEFYAKAAEGELNYQALLRERSRQQAAAHATNLKGLKEEQLLLTRQTKDIKSQQGQLFAQLQGQQFVESETYKHGTWFRKAKTTQNLQGLAGMGYDQIEQLYTQGKLTEGAKALFEQLKKLKEEGVDVANELKEVAKQAAELATGTNVDSLANTIIQDLKDGKNGLQNVMSDYNSIIQNALLSSFQSNIVKKELEAFYAKLSAAAESDGIITEEEKDNLAQDYADLRNRIKREADTYSAVTGVAFTDPNGSASSGNSLSGAIKGITADQADLLAGQFGGLRLTQLQTNTILTDIRSSQEISKFNAYDILKIATDHLQVAIKTEANTRRTADTADAYLPYLKSMDNKLADSLGVQLRAAGKYGY